MLGLYQFLFPFCNFYGTESTITGNVNIDNLAFHGTAVPYITFGAKFSMVQKQKLIQMSSVFFFADNCSDELLQKFSDAGYALAWSAHICLRAHRIKVSIKHAPLPPHDGCTCLAVCSECVSRWCSRVCILRSCAAISTFSDLSVPMTSLSCSTWAFTNMLFPAFSSSLSFSLATDRRPPSLSVSSNFRFLALRFWTSFSRFFTYSAIKFDKLGYWSLNFFLLKLKAGHI